MYNNSTILIDSIKNYISSSQPESILTNHDLELCTQFGLGAIIADIYLQNESLFNDIEKLRSIKITAQYYSTLFDSSINEIINTKSEPKIIYVLLKGIHLSKSHYKHTYQRRMGDIDFLVQKDQTDKVSQFLFDLGYKQEGHHSDEFFKTHQHLKPFHHPKKGTWVEVHTCLFSLKTHLSKRKLFQPQSIFENLTPIESCTENIYGLNAELNLHYTISHWIWEFKITSSLIQLVDIILLINKNTINWDEFIADIESASQATEIKITLDILIKNKLIQIPERKQKEIFNLPDSAGVIGRWLMRTIVNGYLSQNKLITKVIGRTNCSRVWYAYLNDAHSSSNHFRALFAILFADVPGSKSKYHSIKIRLKRLYTRFINRN